MKERFWIRSIPENRIFQWYGFPYGEEKVLSQYWRPDDWGTSQEEDRYHATVQNNLDTWWIPLIAENPQVEFTFFIPPYSMIFWDSASRTGARDAYISAWKYAAEYLMTYENVQVFAFGGIEKIVGNLWNYKDESHYHLRVNDYITECFAEGKHLLTHKNIEDTFAAWKKLTSEYNYEIYFSNPLRGIKDLNTYLDTIDYENCAVILSVGAEYYQQIEPEIQVRLNHLGLTPVDNFTGTHYVAIKSQDNIVSDTIQNEQKSVSYEAAGHTVCFEQVETENTVLFSIRVDGIEYSQNSSGVSFVVLDLKNDRVIDSVSFDDPWSANRWSAWSDNPEHRDYLRQKLVF